MVSQNADGGNYRYVENCISTRSTKKILMVVPLKISLECMILGKNMTIIRYLLNNGQVLFFVYYESKTLYVNQCCNGCFIQLKIHIQNPIYVLHFRIGDMQITPIYQSNLPYFNPLYVDCGSSHRAAVRTIFKVFSVTIKSV